MPRPRLTAANSVVLVIDIQDKLLAKVQAASSLVKSTAFLLDAAKLVGVPVRATEQYPKGLGPTTVEIMKRLPVEPTAKTSFSSCGAAGFLADLRNLAKPNAVITGMETHVCVLQTALDLLDAGITVFLPIDALATRHEIDNNIGLQRLDKAGAILSTVETIGFEWLGDSAHSQFKAFSQLVQGRSYS